MTAVASWPVVADGRHVVVVDLGFGDAGKGATVDWLCSPHSGLDVSAVVRFNGGAQAAHNVVVGGRHHTFRQFGSGTFSGVRTLLSRYVLVDPYALAQEAEELAALGVARPLDLVEVHRDALVTTPLHVLANRAREDARGPARHGSCGTGVGETAAYALEHPDALRVRDCADGALVNRKLVALLEYYRPLLAPDGALPAGAGPGAICDMVQTYLAFAQAVRIVGDERLAELAAAGTLVFEGAQGVLLDEWHGFHPHTTWSTTTPDNALSMLAEIGSEATVLGVTRSYSTRHGHGPFPSESADLDGTLPEPHNGTGRYQGEFRVGHLDLPLLRYAVQASRRVDALVVNHLDAVDTGALRVVDGHVAADGRPLPAPTAAFDHDLDRQQALTDTFLGAGVVTRPVTGRTVLEEISAGSGLPVVLIADGPDRSDRTPVLRPALVATGR